MSSAPTAIYRYVILERLGQGGMGELFLARDPLLDRLVAIKLLRAGFEGEELRERFAREARSAARLAHINIVTIYDVGEHEGQPFIAMEYVKGETLAQKIKRQAPLPLAAKIQHMDELCAGLAHAHRARIVHRDIKPANLIVSADGTLKILDFGIARLGDSSITQAGMLMGTLNYMSPEQITGQPLDHRSDIFAVGAVFYELLSYRQAFPGGIDSGVLNRIIVGTPTALSQLCAGIDPGLVRIVDRALAKNPADRFQDLIAMREELAAVRQRLDPRVLESSGVAPEVGEETVALDTPRVQPRTPRRGTAREDIKKRRAEEIAKQLRAAREAMAGGRFEEAAAACERVLILEPEHEEALDLSERARVAIEQNQIREWLSEARAELGRGNLGGARDLVSRVLSLDADSDEARKLRAAVEQADRRRQADEAVARGRASLEQGDAAGAAAAATEALRLDPTNTGAATLRRDAERLAEEQRRKAEQDRRAREAIADARRRFGRGELDEALTLLQAFSPPHPEVTAALQELRAEAREIRRRELERERQVAAEIVIARAALTKDDLATATSALDRARAIAAEHPEIAVVARAIEARRVEIARAAEEARRRAEEDAKRRAEDAKRQEEDAKRRAEDAKRRKEEEEARRHTEEAAKRQAEEARRREEDAKRREGDAKRREEDEARRRAADEEKRRAADEEKRRAGEEEKRRAQEDARRRAEQALEEARAKRRAEEAAKRREAEEEAKRRALVGDETVVAPPSPPRVVDETVVVPPEEKKKARGQPAPAEAPKPGPQFPPPPPKPPVQPSPPPVPPVITPTDTAERTRRLVTWLGAAAALVAAVSVAIWFAGRDTTPPATTPGTLVIDAAPWAEIVQVRGANGPITPSANYTPVALVVPEGNYTITLRDSNGSERTITARVASGETARAFAEFKPVDVDEYFRRVGS